MRVNAALQEFMFDLAGNKAMPGALKKRDKKADKDKKLKAKAKEEDRLANGPGYNQSDKFWETQWVILGSAGQLLSYDKS